jgi:hypothetical protein
LNDRTTAHLVEQNCLSHQLFTHTTPDGTPPADIPGAAPEPTKNTTENAAAGRRDRDAA